MPSSATEGCPLTEASVLVMAADRERSQFLSASKPVGFVMEQ